MITRKWSTVKALFAAVIFVFAASPALANSDDANARSVDRMRATIAANAEKALQTQGGSRILLKVDATTLREAMVTRLRDDLYRIAHNERIPFSGLATRDGSVEVRIAAPADRDRLLRKLMPPTMETSHEVSASDGGDGLLRLAPTDAAFAESLHELVRDSIAMIDELLRDGGIKQAGEQPDGADRIRITLPGVSDPERVSAMLTKNRQLAFRLVDVSIAPELALKGAMPAETEVLYGREDKIPYLLAKEVLLGGDDVIDVMPGFDSATRQPIASLRFNAAGARRIAHITADNVGRPFAILLDDAVLSASVIREPISGGTVQINGNFTLQQANHMAMLLRVGTPAGRLSLVEQQVVAPGN